MIDAIKRDREYYEQCWEKAKPKEDALAYWENYCHVVVRDIIKNSPVYETISAEVNIPWFIIAVVHYREGNLVFNRNIINGDRIYGKTFCQHTLKYLEQRPYPWYMKVENGYGYLEMLERHNGMGYANQGLHSPYLWSGSDLGNGTGKYIADGKYDPNAEDGQIGAAVLLRYMIEMRYIPPIEKWVVSSKNIGPDPFKCFSDKSTSLACFKNPKSDQVSEADPNGLAPHEPGAKLDDGKTMAGVLAGFSLALQRVADVGTYGAKKYSRDGWESVPDGIERYTDAAWRHLLAMKHESVDPESHMLHLSHLAWNVLAVLELIERLNPAESGKQK